MPSPRGRNSTSHITASVVTPTEAEGLDLRSWTGTGSMAANREISLRRSCKAGRTACPRFEIAFPNIRLGKSPRMFAQWQDCCRKVFLQTARDQMNVKPAESSTPEQTPNRNHRRPGATRNEPGTEV